MSVQATSCVETTLPESVVKVVTSLPGSFSKDLWKASIRNRVLFTAAGTILRIPRGEKEHIYQSVRAGLIKAGFDGRRKRKIGWEVHMLNNASQRLRNRWGIHACRHIGVSNGGRDAKTPLELFECCLMACAHVLSTMRVFFSTFEGRVTRSLVSKFEDEWKTLANFGCAPLLFEGKPLDEESSAYYDSIREVQQKHGVPENFEDLLAAGEKTPAYADLPASELIFTVASGNTAELQNALRQLQPKDQRAIDEGAALIAAGFSLIQKSTSAALEGLKKRLTAVDKTMSEQSDRFGSFTLAVRSSTEKGFLQLSERMEKIEKMNAAMYKIVQQFVS